MDTSYGIPAQSLTPETLLQTLEVTRQLARPFDLQTLLAEVGRAAETVLQAERATVWLFDADDQALVLCGTDAQAGTRVSLHQGLLGLCARSRRVVNVQDVENHPNFDPRADLDRNNDVRCLLAIPLIDGEDLVGVLQVVDRIDGLFTEDDEHVAVTLAAHCVVAIQRERMTQAMVRAEKLDREIALAREIQISTLRNNHQTYDQFTLHPGMPHFFASLRSSSHRKSVKASMKKR